MKVELIKELKDYVHYRVKDKYSVYRLDKQPYICECSIIYSRNLYTECKHIKAVKQFIENESLN
jgi:hypothetical protein